MNAQANQSEVKSAEVIDLAEKKPHRWQKGQSGNPKGRSKETYRISELARQHTESALKTLAEICKDSKASPNARVSAATALLDRAWGKPIQAMEDLTDRSGQKDWREVLAEHAPSVTKMMAESQRLEAAAADDIADLLS